MVRYSAFCKIVELGSFTKAAAEMGYTQAAVSQMIQSLESDLGFTLLHRSRTGVRLTKEGKRLMPLIQKSVHLNREIEDIANEIRGLSVGEVRIGTFSSISQNWLPGLIHKFEETYPNVRFSVLTGDNKSIPEWIDNGIVDFGFVYPRAASGLKVINFAQETFFAVLPEKHHLSEQAEISLEMIEDEPFIVEEEGIANTALEAFENAGLKPNIRYIMHDDYTILSMVEEGLGVSILPATVLSRASYRFKKVMTAPPIKRNIGIAYSSEAMLPIAAKKFINLILDNVPNIIKGKYTVAFDTEKLSIPDKTE